MSDNTTDVKRVLNRLDKIDEHFEETIAADVRYRRLLMVIGAILLLIIVIYVVKSVSELKSIARPEAMTSFIRDKSLELIPQAGARFEDALKANAPTVLQGLREQLVHAVPGALYERTTSLIDRTRVEIVGRAKEASGDVLHNAVSRAEKSLIKLGHEPTVDEIRTALMVGLGAEIENLFPKGQKKHLFKSLTNTEQELRLINARIRSLFKARRLSRYDMLKKRFVQSWTGVGDKKLEDDQDKKGTKKEKKKPAPKKTEAPKPKAPAPAPKP